MGFNHNLKPAIRTVIKTGKTRDRKVQKAYEYYIWADTGLNVDLEKLDNETAEIILQIRSEKEKQKKKERKKAQRRR